MPELPEVEHVVRALRRVIVGRTIVASEIRLRKLIGPNAPATFNRKIKNSGICVSLSVPVHPGMSLVSWFLLRAQKIE